MARHKGGGKTESKGGRLKRGGGRKEGWGKERKGGRKEERREEGRKVKPCKLLRMGSSLGNANDSETNALHALGCVVRPA